MPQAAPTFAAMAYHAYGYPAADGPFLDSRDDDPTIAGSRAAASSSLSTVPASAGTLPIFGNAQTLNMNPLILTNIKGSPYFKNTLVHLTTYHEVVDEIYYKVEHLEPWERGSRVGRKREIYAGELSLGLEDRMCHRI